MYRPLFAVGRNRTTVLSLAAALILGSLFPVLAQADPYLKDLEREKQRKHYLSIRNQVKARQLAYEDIPYDTLGDYPLVPYLKYQDLNKRLNQLPYEEIDSYLETYQDSWLAERLLHNWLELLVAKNRWHEFQSYYRPTVSDTELQCLHIQARANHGEPEALSEVAELWNQGKSLPKRCDTLFSNWFKSDYFNTDIAWSRYVKAVDNRKFGLARYLRSLLDEEQHPLADALVDLYHYPSRLGRLHTRVTKNPAMHDVIHYGVKRYARYNALQALKHWEKFDSAYLFDQQARNETIEYLSYRLILKNHTETANRLLDRNQIVSTRVTERQIRAALKERDWQNVQQLIAKLPSDVADEHRWRYWSLRAAEQLDEIDDQALNQGYQELSKARDFYSFLAAERTQIPFTMSHKAVALSEEQILAIANKPALQRSQELFTLGYINQARMEWRYGTQGMEHEELLAAGKLANAWGWHRKTIESLGQAKYWDDLNLRFPVIYSDEVSLASQETAVPPEYILAVARQESAFAADARSPAGAMGLMQLMPATASQTARSIGMKYRKADLLEPSQNLLLGGTYLSQMLERFDGNRILATAAYNAGPHRVDRWRNPAGQEVEFDIWIETIPFKETRGYVQNVLTYSVIYSHWNGNFTAAV